MSAKAEKTQDERVFEALRRLGASGDRVDSGALREEAGVTAAQVRESVQRLRWKGRIQPGRLEIAESERRWVSPPSALAVEAEAPRLVEVVAQEARTSVDRRRKAGSLGKEAGVDLDPRRDPVAAVMIAGGPETPGEAIGMVRARWPETWARLVHAARARRASPGALMIEILESALGGAA